MKAIYILAAVGAFGLGLVGWAAFARGQGRLLVAAAGPKDDGPALVVPSSGEGPMTPAALAPMTAPPPSPRLANVVVAPMVSPPAQQTLPPQQTMPLPPPMAVPATLSKHPIPQPPVIVTRNTEGNSSRPRDLAGNRQEAGVSLEWVGPAKARLHHPTEYTLLVRDTNPAPVEQVVVRVLVPAGMVLAGAEPAGTLEGKACVWQLGTLRPGQEKSIKVRLQPESRGEAIPQAWATFTTASQIHVQVHEPKLALKVQAPQRVAFGDMAAFVVTVNNPGDGPAEHVKIRANLSDGLAPPDSRQPECDLGTVPPGESRATTLTCSPLRGGKETCEITVEAEGGLTAHEQASVGIVAPKLEIHATGPAFRYLERKAAYTIRIRNTGEVAAGNVMLADMLPEGAKFLLASAEGRHDPAQRTITWSLGDLAPGQAKDVQVELAPLQPGEMHQQIVAQTDRGLKEECQVATRVEGLSAIVAEVVDTDNPVEVGAETTYEVHVLNAGSKAEADLKVVCTVPDKMEFKAAQGPGKYRVEGKDVIFDPLVKLPQRGQVQYRITTKALAPGDVRFKVQLTSGTLIEPLVRTEFTRIYSDSGK